MHSLSCSEVQDMEDDSSSLTSTLVTNRTEQVTEDLIHPVKSLCENEQQEVEEFIERHKNNSGVIDLLQLYLIQLANKADRQW